MATIVVEGTNDLERDLNRLPQAFAVIHARYSQALAGGWKKSILDVDAVDTRRYLFSIAAHAAAGAASAKEFVIDTSDNSRVMYSDIVERGRRDHPNYPVRWPAGKSLERQHDIDLLDRIATKALGEFLHG